MHCNGKCHLAKEIKKAAEEDQAPTSNQTALKISFFQELPVKALRLRQGCQLTLTRYGNLIAIHYSPPSLEVFSPPPELV